MRERGDWDVWHNKGLCYMYLNDLEAAVDAFSRANAIQRHDVSYLMLSKIAELRGDRDGAKAMLVEALEFSPEDSTLLSTLGQLYMGDNDELRAFDALGKALSHNPRDVDTLLAAASVMQSHSDYDGALAKLRAVAVLAPNSPHLWTNAGLCFFGKNKPVAAISCLKRALFLAPFEWIINYNLGIIHLSQDQTASAYHFCHAAVRLNPDLAAGYMYLGVILSKLGDYQNASTAYHKAHSLLASVPQDPQTSQDLDRLSLNHAITAHRYGDTPTATAQFAKYEELVKARKSRDIPSNVHGPLAAMRAIYGSAQDQKQDGKRNEEDGGDEVRVKTKVRKTRSRRRA